MISKPLYVFVFKYQLCHTTLEVFLTYILWISPVSELVASFAMQKDARGFGVEIPPYKCH